MNQLAPGISGVIEHQVTDKDTATQWGSGLVPVLSTPALVGLMEAAAVEAIEKVLPPGSTSVGSHIDIHHIAATPVGMTIHIKAELTEVNGRKLLFKISARDQVEVIGEALHERVIVDREKFTDRVNSKKAA